jgi:hypothetical protein
MNAVIRKPSIFRVIENDYTALMGLIVPVLSWLFYLAFRLVPSLKLWDPLINTIGSQFFLLVGAIATLVGLALVVWRIKFFEDIFQAGIEAQGRIKSVNFLGDRCRIEFTYIFRNETFVAGKTVRRSARAQMLQPGQPVILLVDPDERRRILIRDLFI